MRKLAHMRTLDWGSLGDNCHVVHVFDENEEVDDELITVRSPGASRGEVPILKYHHPSCRVLFFHNPVPLDKPSL